jgi:hypothetical protein
MKYDTKYTKISTWTHVTEDLKMTGTGDFTYVQAEAKTSDKLIKQNNDGR